MIRHHIILFYFLKLAVIKSDVNTKDFMYLKLRSSILLYWTNQDLDTCDIYGPMQQVTKPKP